MSKDTIMNKKAFSLVEVIVAVVLLATVGMTLLKIGTNNQDIILFTQNYAKKTDLFSIPFNHKNQDFHNTTKSLYDFLQGSYDLDDESRKTLKSIKVNYKHKEVMSEQFPVNENTSVDIKGFEISVKIDSTEHKEISFELH